MTYKPTVPHKWYAEFFRGLILPKPRPMKGVSVMDNLPPLTKEQWEQAKGKEREQVDKRRG